MNFSVHVATWWWPWLGSGSLGWWMVQTGSDGVYLNVQVTICWQPWVWRQSVGWWMVQTGSDGVYLSVQVTTCWWPWLWWQSMGWWMVQTGSDGVYLSVQVTTCWRPWAWQESVGWWMVQTVSDELTILSRWQHADGLERGKRVWDGGSYRQNYPCPGLRASCWQHQPWHWIFVCWRPWLQGERGQC